MIRKNVFLILNNVVCELYRCQTYAELGRFFLPVLRMLIPFRYASIMRRENTTEHIRLVDPLCIPSEFLEAEQNYMRFADDDYTGWLNCCRESTLFRESDLVGEQQRLRSTIYQKCYQKFHVYDSLQYGIVFNGRPLGALSLFRHREDGPFTSDDLFLLSSVGIHLNQHMSSLLDKMYHRETVSGYDLSAVAKKYKLTGREVQLIEQLTRFRDNREIAEAMQVRDSTLQKHFQNIFRKLDVSSRWEIMRLLLEGDPRS